MNPSEQAEQISKKAAEAALLMGVAIGMQLEHSQHKKEAWQRAAERYRELGEQAERLSGQCEKRSRD